MPATIKVDATCCNYVRLSYSRGMTITETTACQLQASFACTGTAVMERLDPMAMAPENPAPAVTVPTCRECFATRSDEFLRVSAR